MKDYEVKSAGDPGNVARSRAYRQRRKASFQCQSCGGLTIAGQTRCPGCKVRIREAMTQRRENRISQGLCYSCGKAPASALGKQCPGCTEKTRVQNAKDRQRRMQEATDAQQGLGEEVGDSEYETKAFTPEQKRALRERRIAQSLCKDCGASVVGTSSLCATCKGKARISTIRRRYKLASQGLCISCGKVPAPEGKKCPGCVEKQKVISGEAYERKRQYLAEQRELEEQQKPHVQPQEPDEEV